MSGSTTRLQSSSSLADPNRASAIAETAEGYREEGYDVVVEPAEGPIPAFLAGFRPDLIATKAGEAVVVAIRRDRFEVARDDSLPALADVVAAQPGWRFDVVILGVGSKEARIQGDASEPSDKQLASILRTAEDLADRGLLAFAHVVAGGGLEAAMRRIREDAELFGGAAPLELIRTLYSNGFLNREQYERLDASFRYRSQVAHGLVPDRDAPEPVRFLTDTARSLAFGAEATAASF